ncbi:hypothetical protein BGW36DRAFT_430256 [Talaromyces proteolyticus]|uniref:Uncharacterized protein n=1 Tax=Talaromyces proteolyticus TaxID=1131652 RepID=A0AAD4PU63_9EURO|nr:uncharacterized protein BGW36DRAFT_430256 [Talaromyces proteolyticus]KAH8694238.1 hypothetical protein BGW36DRAFT_430256 [Talaromyces proteolyticus]
MSLTGTASSSGHNFEWRKVDQWDDQDYLWVEVGLWSNRFPVRVDGPRPHNFNVTVIRYGYIETKVCESTLMEGRFPVPIPKYLVERPGDYQISINRSLENLPTLGTGIYEESRSCEFTFAVPRPDPVSDFKWKILKYYDVRVEGEAYKLIEVQLESHGQPFPIQDSQTEWSFELEVFYDVPSPNDDVDDHMCTTILRDGIFHVHAPITLFERHGTYGVRVNWELDGIASLGQRRYENCREDNISFTVD